MKIIFAMSPTKVLSSESNYSDVIRSLKTAEICIHHSLTPGRRGGGGGEDEGGKQTKRKHTKRGGVMMGEGGK